MPLAVASATALRLPLRSGSAQLVVTSPPYWALRDYRGVKSEWPAVEYSPMPGLEAVSVAPMSCQLGHEPTPADFVGHLVLCAREWRRVLHDTGTLWFNLGDTYQASGNLTGIPWRAAYALQADGWILRSAVVWAKPNPMPESLSGWRWERCRVKTGSHRTQNQGFAAAGGHRDKAHGDIGLTPSATWAPCPGCAKCEPNGGLVLRRGSWRPTQSYEMLFMLAKGPGYFGDGEAVREACQGTKNHTRHAGNCDNPKARNADTGSKMNSSFAAGTAGQVSSRNIRDVWTLSTRPNPLAHFAAFPEELVEPCIKSCSPERVCAECGTPWAPVIEKGESSWERRKADGDPNRYGRRNGSEFGGAGHAGELGRSLSSADDRSAGGFGKPSDTLVSGHLPSCACGAGHRPPLVVDPFGGTGTVARVARRLGRNAATFDIVPAYCRMAFDRAGEACVKALASRARTMATITGPLFQEDSVIA